MSKDRDPILAQFASPPRIGGGVWRAEINRVTGLLHEPGAMTPLVEELIALGGRWRGGEWTVTIITEARDPVDPDLVRGESLRRVEAGVTTFFTKADLDPVDPDLVRAEAVCRAVDPVATLTTREVSDTPDPDLVRDETGRSDGIQAY